MDLNLTMSGLSVSEFKQIARMVGGCDCGPQAPAAKAGTTVFFGDGRRSMLAVDRPLPVAGQHQVIPGIFRIAPGGSSNPIGRMFATLEGSVYTERFALDKKALLDDYLEKSWSATHLDETTVPPAQQLGSNPNDAAGIAALAAYVSTVSTAWTGKLVYKYQSPPSATEIGGLAPTPSSWTTRTFKVVRDGNDQGRLYREMHTMTTGEVVVDEYWLLDKNYTSPPIGKALELDQLSTSYSDLRDFLTDQTGNPALTKYVQGTLHFKPA